MSLIIHASRFPFSLPTFHVPATVIEEYVEGAGRAEEQKQIGKKKRKEQQNRRRHIVGASKLYSITVLHRQAHRSSGTLDRY